MKPLNEKSKIILVKTRGWIFPKPLINIGFLQKTSLLRFTQDGRNKSMNFKVILVR